MLACFDLFFTFAGLNYLKRISNVLLYQTNLNFFFAIISLFGGIGYWPTRIRRLLSQIVRMENPDKKFSKLSVPKLIIRQAEVLSKLESQRRWSQQNGSKEPTALSNSGHCRLDCNTKRQGQEFILLTHSTK